MGCHRNYNESKDAILRTLVALACFGTMAWAVPADWDSAALPIPYRLELKRRMPIDGRPTTMSEQILFFV